MDAKRFDTALQVLAETRSRRGVAAAIVAAVLGLVSLDTAEANKKKRKARRRQRRDRRGSNTCNTTSGGACGPAERSCKCANGSAGGAEECLRDPGDAAQPCPATGGCPRGQLCLKASDDVAYCLTP